MIYELTLDVQAALETKSYPVRVLYGEHMEGTHHREASMVIHVDRNRQSGDGPPTAPKGQGVTRNADTRLNRMIGAVAKFYVRSELEGAMLPDHERSCDQLVDAFLTELELWGRANRAGWIPVSGSRYLRRDEMTLPDGNVWPGVGYEVVFAVPRAVAAKDYTRSGRPTAALAGFANQTRVHLPATDIDPDDPEPTLACGA